MTMWVGRTAERSVEITDDLIDRFAALSGDDSAIHVNESAALARGLRGRVAHGMLLGALVSQVVGVELPGHCGILQEARLSFRNPCYPGDTLRIVLEATEFFESVGTIVLRLTITNQHGTTVATGRIQSGVQT